MQKDEANLKIAMNGNSPGIIPPKYSTIALIDKNIKSLNLS
jgi:hypothetical protein